MSLKDTLNNPLTQIESSIGFTSGIMIGALASWVFIIFFTSWEWYFKLFSSIGEIGIMGSLGLQLYNLIQARKNYLEVQKQMKEITSESNDIISQQNL